MQDEVKNANQSLITYLFVNSNQIKQKLESHLVLFFFFDENLSKNAKYRST